jgi:uncharacterized protein
MSFYDRIRHPAADSVARTEATGSLESLDGCNYCVLVTYRRSGEPVPTPVWFGVADGRLYVRTDAGSWKVKRIRGNARVMAAPSTMRGRPLGPAFEGVARVLEPSEYEPAERALASNYGLGRRLYVPLLGEAHPTYIEVRPAAG